MSVLYGSTWTLGFCPNSSVLRRTLTLPLSPNPILGCGSPSLSTPHLSLRVKQGETDLDQRKDGREGRTVEKPVDFLSTFES